MHHCCRRANAADVQDPREEEDMALRIKVKQLPLLTQTWEYMVEWKSGRTTWCTATGDIQSTVLEPSTASSFIAPSRVPQSTMTQLIQMFDSLGRRESETINFGSHGFGVRVVVKAITNRVLRSSRVSRTHSKSHGYQDKDARSEASSHPQSSSRALDECSTTSIALTTK